MSSMPLSTRFILCTRNKSERKSHNQIATLRACFGCLKMLRIAVGRHSDDNLRLNRKLTIILPSCFHLALIKYEKETLRFDYTTSKSLQRYPFKFLYGLSMHTHRQTRLSIRNPFTSFCARTQTPQQIEKERINRTHCWLLSNHNSRHLSRLSFADCERRVTMVLLVSTCVLPCNGEKRESAVIENRKPLNVQRKEKSAHLTHSFMRRVIQF